ncbi:MAG TPA: hypothetical protein VIU64_04215, partial [Polyangia bacterium]
SQPIPQSAGEVSEPLTQPTVVDGYPDYDDLSDGITRVDLNRSALALEKLRAFDAKASLSGGVRQAGVGTAGASSPVSPHRAPTGERVAAASELASRSRRGPPPGRPASAGDASWPELPGPRTPPAPFQAVAASPAEAPVEVPRSRSISLRRAPRVGRRVGLFIAAATAAAVAPLIGSWTARFESAASARGGAEAPSLGGTIRSLPAGAAPPTITVVAVPPAAPAAAPRQPALDPQSTLPREPSGRSPDAPERGSSPDPGAKDRLLGAVESRPAQKSSGGKKSRRRIHQSKVTTAAAAPRAAAARPAGPPAGPARLESRASGDPDDTLPIAIP